MNKFTYLIMAVAAQLMQPYKEFANTTTELDCSLSDEKFALYKRPPLSKGFVERYSPG
jgi:hypothetical protein